MLILNGKYENIKNSGFYDDNCWDYPYEEEKMLWEDKQYSNVIYVKAENGRIYETNCTINDLKDLIEKLDEEQQFNYKKFYCVYVDENDENYTLTQDKVNTKQLNIYIKDEEELVHINTFYIQKNASLDETKKLLEDVLCCEIGKVLEDGTIEKEYHGQGYIYKNYENFYTREGVCYVSEYDGDKIDNAGVTYDDIRDEVIEYLLSCEVNIENISNKEINAMIIDVFETVDWQYTSTLISEDWLDGYVEDMNKESCNEEEIL